MMPLNRDDDARRLFTEPKTPLWVKVALVCIAVPWLYVCGRVAVWAWGLL